MRALRNKFDGVAPPPPPQRERLQSALDAPRAELGDEAKSARDGAATRVRNSTTEAPKLRRYVPQIGPADSDEARHLKRQIQAREQEIQAMCAKLLQVAERLDRVASIFHASLQNVAAPVAAPEDPNKPRMKAFSADAPVDGAAAATSAASSAAASAKPTSLEAILAAARSGGNSSRAQSEKPKYSKLLRNMQ